MLIKGAFSLVCVCALLMLIKTHFPCTMFNGTICAEISLLPVCVLHQKESYALQKDAQIKSCILFSTDWLSQFTPDHNTAPSCCMM